LERDADKEDGDRDRSEGEEGDDALETLSRRSCRSRLHLKGDDVPEVQLVYRQLERADLARLANIDRTERIEHIYVQHGTELEEVAGDFSATPWHAEGKGPHSVTHQREECERYLAAGGTGLGAFDAERLVGIGVVMPHVRPGIAQLAYLHVSSDYRGRGIGDRLTSDLEQLARDAGATTIVVSATPSENTVRFYRRHGYEPTATPLPELVELEPEDVHMGKRL
jgi:ribosomal protein S18 acetylase RimI-like enzyme